jgi:hypothetical protein
VENHRCYPAAIVQAAFLTNVSARAQDTTTDGYVTRKEYDELKAELLAMKKELDALKKEKGAVSKQGSVESHSVADIHKEVAQRQEEAETQAAGKMHTGVSGNVAPSVAQLEASLFGRACPPWRASPGLMA